MSHVLCTAEPSTAANENMNKLNIRKTVWALIPHEGFSLLYSISQNFHSLVLVPLWSRPEKVCLFHSFFLYFFSPWPHFNQVCLFLTWQTLRYLETFLVSSLSSSPRLLLLRDNDFHHLSHILWDMTPGFFLSIRLHDRSFVPVWRQKWMNPFHP